jgi:hypothetical protein
VAVVFTGVFGIPVYFAYRRCRITSFLSYVATGFVLSVPVAAWALWDEYSGGYENAGQTLLQHTIELVSLLSGPSAAAVFWRTVRPDMRDAAFSTTPAVSEVSASAEVTSTASKDRIRHASFVALGGALLAWIVLSLYGTLSPRRDGSKTPLATEYLSFDSTKSADLVSSLKAYAASHSAHLGYYFMPVSIPKNLSGAPAMPPVLLMANLEFPGGIEITVMNPGNKGLGAFIYSETNRFDDRSNQLWSDFDAFLRTAVDHANSLPATELPDIPSRGEGGKLETHWWDWRFHRQ